MTDLLVTGASGHLGQAVLRHLLDTLHVPASRIVATTRKPESLAALADRGVTVRAADFDDSASAKAAFGGVKRLLLISTDALDGAGTRLAQHKVAVKAAAEAGVEHIVYTSLPEAEKSLVSFAPDHFGTEKAIAASGIAGWTILRNSWYFENLAYALPSALASGSWYSAANGGKFAYIARDDLALAAATALAADFSGRRTLTLGGSEGISAEEVAALASKITGKPISVVQVPIEGLVQGMISHGLPEPVARTFASFDAAAEAGHLGVVTGDFEALTGKAPQPLKPWLEQNAASFAPPAAA